MENAVRRVAARLFARVPQAYLTMLKVLRRGSAEKGLYLSLVRRGDVVIDAGANVGYFTMLFSDLVGSHGEVHAFEPVPATFQLLAGNIRRFPYYKNVHLNCAALGDRDERTRILVPKGDCRQAALVRHRDGSWRDAEILSINAEMLRLDRYAERLAKIDFVKCDVEGAELLVFRGGESTLRRCQPKIYFEAEERWTNSFGWKACDVFRFLRDVGYKHFYGIEPGRIRIIEDRFTGGILCSWKELSGLA
jgi:FkbM family methyltransferase